MRENRSERGGDRSALMVQELGRTLEARDVVNSLPTKAVSNDPGEKGVIEDILSVVGQPIQNEVEMKEVTRPRKPTRKCPRKEVNNKVDVEPNLGQCFGNITVVKGSWKCMAREKVKTEAQAQEFPTQVNIIGLKRKGKIDLEEEEGITVTKRRCEHSTKTKTEVLEESVVAARQHRREPRVS